MEDVLQDIKKLFTRIHQLEIRQVNGKKDVEMQLRKALQLHDEELTRLRAQTDVLETKDSERNVQMGILLENAPEHEKRVDDSVFQCQEVDKKCQKHAEMLASLEARLQSLDLARKEAHSFKQATNVRLDEMISTLARQEAVDKQAALMKASEKRITVQVDRVKHALEVLNHHGLVLDTTSLSKRQEQIDEACKHATKFSEEARQDVERVASRMDKGLQRVDSEIVEMKGEILTNLDDLKQRVEITEEGFADLTDRLQKVHMYEPDISLAVDSIQEEGASPNSLDRINTTGSIVKGGGIPNAKFAQCLEELEELTHWRQEVKDEMDRLHRLGRIMEDRLEAFDVVERRTKDMAEQLEAMAPRDSSPPRGTRSRSSSPGWRTFRPGEHPDLTLNGKGSPAKAVEIPQISSPHFEGSGWAKAPPRRPYSAGAVRGEVPSQLQQLREKLLQAVPALPAELQKQLQANTGADQTVFSCVPRPGAMNLSRPGSGRRPPRRPGSAR